MPTFTISSLREAPNLFQSDGDFLRDPVLYRLATVWTRLTAVTHKRPVCMGKLSAAGVRLRRSAQPASARIESVEPLAHGHEVAKVGVTLEKV